MRHRKNESKLGRTSAHGRELSAALVCGLIKRKRIRTTLAKAKVARPLAEKMVTLGLDGSLSARRRAVARLRDEQAVAELFSAVAPTFNERPGGYTRIVKAGSRNGDGSDTAILEWVGIEPPRRKKPAKQAEE